MSERANRAVFLSYASQDAEAARRISESLRSAGVEVWFDADGGLEHGDEWDAKIRRQIKECVLFLPIISANTQARHEGYFRIEWELAAQRAMGIASGIAFILPVVIDDTGEPGALVPDRFRAVQWTRVPDGELRPEMRARLLALWSQRIGLLPSAGQIAGNTTAPTLVALVPPRRFGRPVLAGIAAAVMVVAAMIAWGVLRPKIPMTGGRPGSGTTAAAGSEADRLVARALASIDRMNYTRADVAAAEVLARKATDLAPDSADAWAARAFVQAASVWRGWDRGGEQRKQDIEASATRALAIDAKQVRAMIALGELFSAQQAYMQAEVFARRGLALRPDDAHLHRLLAGALDGQKRGTEAAALLEDSARKFPRDPLIHYGLGNLQVRDGDFAGALASFERALAIETFTSALLNKARLLVGWKGDLAGARAVMEQIAPEDRTEMRAVGVAMWVGLLEHRSDRVQAAAALTAESYLTDSLLIADGPKVLSVALAYQIEGKQALAQQQWQAAEAAARTRIRNFPSDPGAPIYLAIALASLGRNDEAAREVAVSEAAVREQPEGRGRMAVLVARYHAARGDAARAMAFLRLIKAPVIDFSPRVLRIDPWWDKIRAAPEFAAFLEEKTRENPGLPRAPADAPAPDPKSIAVLAFDNLSDDKANEYFSDGISEELIDQLGRVPGLTVKGRTSAFYFKGNTKVTSAEIARQLGVAYLVRGSVGKSGNKVRITAQLSRAVNDEVVWSSQPITKELADVFTAQEEIAGFIAQSLQLKLGLQPAASGATSAEALRLYLEGRQIWNLRTRQALDHAEALFNQALALDPKFARARVGRADVWMQRYAEFSARGENLARFANRGSPLVAKITTEAEAALTEDPKLAEAHTTIGNALSLTWQDAAAEEHFRRALSLNPNYATTHHWLGRLLLREGRMDEARTELAKAADLDPLSPIILDNYGMVLLCAGEAAAALPVIERALLFRPDSVQTLSWQAWALTDLGRIGDAVAVARRLAQNPNAALFAQNLNAAYATPRAFLRAGMKEEAEAFVRRPDVLTDELRWIAQLGIGRPAEALTYLQPDAVKSMEIHYLLFLPEFDPVRNDPRFQQVLKTLGVVEAHARAQAWRAAHPPAKPALKP